MKKFWLVLLSLGLIMAFSVSAFAVDVKVSGEYYAAGMYLNKTTVADPLQKNVGYPFTANYGHYPHAAAQPNPSTAFFYQRLRVGTDFIVSPGLKLVTRFDAMERIWGGKRSDPGTSDVLSAGTRAENENIAFDLCYIDYTSPIGKFIVGYYKDYDWGTIFGNKYGANGMSNGQIAYVVPIGPVYISANMIKETDRSASAVTPGASTTDQDYDSYRLAATYKAKNIIAGLLFLWERDATGKANGLTLPSGAGLEPYLLNAYALTPYFKATFGPVFVQGEFAWGFGNAAKWEDDYTGMAKISINSISAFLDATANFGMFYVGGSFAYLSGDDPDTNDKLEGSGNLLAVNTGGLDWNPCLIMFNNDITYWVGGIQGNGLWPANSYTEVGGTMKNAWFFQGRVGVKPTPQWDVMLSLSYAAADEKPGHYYSPPPQLYHYNNTNGTYGTEIDVTATYKITNNLTYMLGAGYLFTGDYYKGYEPAYSAYGLKNETDDNYMLINKLTLTF
jgi:hypothetical protein